MSANPFDRNRTKEARLGELITEPGEQNQRDAVHIAVVPVKAGCVLHAGDHVGVSKDGATVSLTPPFVGIVDPFLPGTVVPGQTFWLFLYQGQVTTLRHEWTHPAFPNVHQAPVVDDSAEKMVAMRRMRSFFDENAYDSGEWANFAEFLEVARTAAVDGDSIYMGSNEGVQAYAEFMEDLAILTGAADIRGKEAPYFSCGC